MIFGIISCADLAHWAAHTKTERRRLQMDDLLRVATQLAAREEHVVQRAVRVRNPLNPAERLDIAVGKPDLQAVHEPLIGNAVDREARDEGPLVLPTPHRAVE